MTNELYAALAGAIVGSVIAGFFAWLLPLIQEKRNLHQKRQLFTISLIDDLKVAPLLYERISNDWEKTGQIWFEYLIELKEQRKIYQRNSDYILLYPEQLRSEIFKYYFKTDKLIYLLEALQNRMSFLISQFETTLKNIKMTHTSLDDQEALKYALALHADADQEVIKIRSLIDEQVKKIINSSTEAKTIQNQLEQYK